MKYIYSNWVEYARNPDNSYNILGNLYKVTTENEIVRRSLELVNSTDHPSLIIIDEISKFTAYDLDLVNQFAKNNGITVLAAGDFDLSGVVGKHPVTLEGISGTPTWNVSLDRTNFIRSPKLGVSMRTDNTLKTNNLTRTLLYLNNPEGVLELEYAENEEGLFGDKVIPYDLSFVGELVVSDKNNITDLILAEIEKLALTLKEGEKIGYIYTDKASKLYQELSKKPYIDLREGGSAQGLEGRYYIIDLGYTSADPDVKTFLKDLYTGISRAQLGSIIIAPYGNPGTNKFVPIKAEPKNEVPIKETVSNGVIKKYAQKRKDVLDKVVTEGKVDPVLLRTPTKPAVVTTLPQTEGLQSGPTAEELAAAQLAAIEAEKQTLLQAISLAQSEDEINLLIINSRQALLGADADILNAKTLRLLELAEQNRPDVERIIDTLPEDIREYVRNIRNITLDPNQNSDGLRTNDPILRVGDIIYDDNGEIAVISSFFLDSDGFGVSVIYPESSGPDFSKGELGYFGGDLLYGNISQIIYSDNPNATIDKLRNLEKPEVPETPLPTPDLSEDDIAPIPLTSTGGVADIVPTAQIQAEIDLSNESRLVPEASIGESTNGPIPIDMLLHSFNTFETGVLEGDNGEVILIGSPELTAMRIDSVNGLIKIDNLLGTSKRSLQEYVNMLGDLRSIIFNNTEKADIEQILADYLGLLNIYTTFALKSSPRIDDNARTDEFGYFGNSSSPYNKSNKERTLFNGSKDINSNKIHDRSLVLIIGSNIDGKNQNLLELPLLALSSPFTLLKVLKNGVPAFPEILNTFELLANAQNPNWKVDRNLNLVVIAQGILDKHRGDVQYKELLNLFDLFLKTGGFVKYVRDPLWTPAKALQLLGTHVVNKKGYYLMLPGLDFNDTTNPESEWISLADFACDSKTEYHKNKYGNRLNSNHNPSTYVTPIFIATNDTFDGIDHPVVHKGHPFVLVSYDSLLNDDESVIEQFLELERDPSIPKKVARLYILPPKAKVSEYLDNIYRMTHVKKGETLILPNIGYFTTNFKLLKGLIEDNLFRELLNRKLSKVAQKLVDILNTIPANASIEYLTLALNQTYDWSADGYGNGPETLKYLFRGVLSKLISVDLTLDDNPEHNKDNEAIKIIEEAAIRIGVDGIYHHFPIPKTDYNSNRYFIIPNLGEENNPYTIDGKQCKIHGKVDSYTFKGHMGEFISLLIASFNLPNGIDPASPNANNRYRTPDGPSYYYGNSSLAPQPIRTLLDKAELDRRKEISNITTLVSSKTGILLESRIFEGKTIQQAKIDIANLINSTSGNNVAFVVNEMLLITNSNSIVQGDNKVIYSNRQPITDITSLILANGIANFEISIDGKIYQAEFDKNNKILNIWELKQAVLNPIPTLSITPENTTEYIQEANNFLSKILNADKRLGLVFKAITYNEFVTALYNLPKSAPARANKNITTRLFMILKIIDSQLLTPLQLQIVNDLMAMEEYKRQEVNNDKTSCPIVTKLLF